MNVHFLKRKVQALKYALSPYTSKAKDIVASNPGGYLWERSKKNPDLPGVKERVPIGTNKNLAGPLHGTKLAVVLQEIRDRFGSVDPQLKALAEKALSGKGNLQHQVSQDNTYAKTKAMIAKAKLGQQAPGEVAQTAAQPFTPEKHEDLFTAIRDRLAQHSRTGTGGSSGSSDLAARAGELARSYNWHRVGAGLQVDEAVRDYINKVTGDRLKHANEAHRTVHNLFGLGSEQRRQGKVSDATHQAFWDGLRKHVNERAKGANSVYGLSARDIKDDMLHKSIRRLAEAEEHIYGTPGKAPTDPPHVGPSYANYKTAGLRQLGPNAKIAPPTFEKPAYSPTKTGVRVNPRARAAQFKRFRKKYGRAPIEGIRGFVNEDSQAIMNPNSNSARALQDFLEDHDDPRHHIVRDDIDSRKGQFMLNTNKKLAQSIGVPHLDDQLHYTNHKTYHLHDETQLEVHRYQNPDNGHTAYSVNWNGGTPNELGFEYVGILHPEQLQQILKEHSAENTYE